MKHITSKKSEHKFEILHGTSGLFYIPYHVMHTGKINHKLHISATIMGNIDNYDILFYILNKEQFVDSIPHVLQMAQGDNTDGFNIEYESEKSENPSCVWDVERDELLFIVFDNRYSYYNNKIILSSIYEEWDEEGKTDNTAFVIMPMGNASMDSVYDAIKSECAKLEIEASRVDDFAGSRLITDDIITQIKKSEFLIVDLIDGIPNVYYELGYAHGSGNKGDNILLIAKKDTDLHFDITGMRVRFYETVNDLHKIIYDDLKKMIKKK